MKEKLRGIIKYEISMKLVAIGALLALAIVLLPIARIMINCVPWYDDFSYGRFTKSFWEQKIPFGMPFVGHGTMQKVCGMHGREHIHPAFLCQ